MRRNLILLLIWILLTLRGCYGFTGNLGEHAVPIGFWLLLVAIFFVYNQKRPFLAWPAEFFFWLTVLLIFIELFYIKYFI